MRSARARYQQIKKIVVRKQQQQQQQIPQPVIQVAPSAHSSHLLPSASISAPPPPPDAVVAVSSAVPSRPSSTVHQLQQALVCLFSPVLMFSCCFLFLSVFLSSRFFSSLSFVVDHKVEPWLICAQDIKECSSISLERWGKTAVLSLYLL